MILLFRQYLRLGRGALLGCAAGMAAYTWFVVSLYPSLGGAKGGSLQQYLQQLPPALKAIVGSRLSLATLDSYLAAEIYSLLPLVLAVYAAVAAAGVLCREVDQGTAEFLFAQPVSRTQVLLGRFAAIAVQLLAVHAAVLLAAWGGAAAAGQSLSLAGSLRALALSSLVALALAALMLLLSLAFSDSSQATFAGLGLALGLYVVTVALRAAGRYHRLLPWLIFGRFDATVAVSTADGFARAAAALLAYALLFVTAAAVLVERRDLRL